MEHLIYLKLQNFYVAILIRKKQVIEIWNDTKEVVEELPTARKYPFKSGVNIIMYGCNNFAVIVLCHMSEDVKNHDHQ